MPPDRDPLRVFTHAVRAGDWRLAELLAERLRLAAVHRTLLVLRRRLGI